MAPRIDSCIVRNDRVYIAQYNADHDAESNISQEQKIELKDALAGVFGQPAFSLEFTSKPD
jgi:hypothetical protein